MSISHITGQNTFGILSIQFGVFDIKFNISRGLKKTEEIKICKLFSAIVI